jgi:ABC-type transporter Mla subunit MlaD
MSAKHRNEVLVGGFVVAALGLFVVLLFLMGAFTGLLRPMTDLRVVFTDIRGLKPGDSVSFLGSKVGRVARVEFGRRRWGEELPDLFPGEEGESTRVLITLRIDGSVFPHIRTGSPVEIDKNLTGNISVLIRDGKGGPLPAGRAILRGTAGVDLAAIADRVDGVLRKAEPAVDGLVGLARRLEESGNIEHAVGDLAAITRELREGIVPVREALAGLIGDARGVIADNRGDLRTIASNLAEGTGLASKVLAKVEPAAEDLRAALAEIEKTAASAGGAIETARPSIEAILEETRSAMANASNLSADVRRRPWRLLYRPSKGELEDLDIYDAAWAYNLGASELDRSLRQLSMRLASAPDGKGDPEALRAAYREVEESLRRHKEAEEAFWARLKAR